MKNTISFIFLVLITPFFNFAQNDSTNIPFHAKVWNDAKIFWNEGVDYFAYPLNADSKDWAIFAGITATTYGLMHADSWVKDNVGRKTTLTRNQDFWDIPTSYGIVTYANIQLFPLTESDYFREITKLEKSEECYFKAFLIRV